MEPIPGVAATLTALALAAMIHGSPAPYPGYAYIGTAAATWYGPKLHAGKLTASGEMYSAHSDTIAVGRSLRYLLGRDVLLVSEHGTVHTRVNDLCGKCDEHGVIADCTPYVHRLISPNGDTVEVDFYVRRE